MDDFATEIEELFNRQLGPIFVELMELTSNQSNNIIFNELVDKMLYGYSIAHSYKLIDFFEITKKETSDFPFNYFIKYGWMDYEDYYACKFNYYETLTNIWKGPQGEDLSNEDEKKMFQLITTISPIIQGMMAIVFLMLDKQILYRNSIVILLTNLENYFQEIISIFNPQKKEFNTPIKRIENKLINTLNIKHPFKNEKNRKTFHRVRIIRNAIVHEGGIFQQQQIDEYSELGITPVPNVGDEVKLNIRTIRLFYKTTLEICKNIESKKSNLITTEARNIQV